MKYLSLLLPTYNRHKKLEKLIRYLNEENVFKNKEIEIIISNNASKDGTEKFINELNYLNLIKYNQEANLGLIGNIRFLTTKATGEYIWVMGDNDNYARGAIGKLLEIIKRNMEISHFFLNYASINGSDEYIVKNVVNKETNIYEKGLDMVYSLVQQRDLGVLMFISANVYKKNIVEEVNCIVDRCGEEDNLALPLGYSLYSAKYKNMCIGDVMVMNEMETPSTWSDKKILVYCRDMIAMYDTIAKTFSEYEKLRLFYIKNLPVNVPEYKYMFFGKKFKKNNYMMSFYKKYYPHIILVDIFKIPIIMIKSIFRKIKKKY